MFHLLLAIIYLSFISLGLPDGLLGSAWPFIYPQFDVPVSYSGIVFMIISGGTIVSSLQSDRLTRKLGTGKVTAISVAMTAAALFGFSFSNSFLMLCLCAIPYGLGAGGVDASLNNYVALHYESKHMSWLHCMWGIGASVGPYIMSAVVTGGGIWNLGYRYVGIIQIVLTAILIFSIPLWKGNKSEEQTGEVVAEALSMKEVFAIPGAKEIMITFLCYCAVEQTVGLWASSYLVLGRGVDAETAAGYASMFYLGITVGRMISGFLTMKFSDEMMTRIGQGIMAVGIVMVVLPFGTMCAVAGLVVIGLGCAPIYPCVIHSTPAHFGAERSQAMIGVQMASAYVGTTLMPPFFGLLAEHISIHLYMVFVAVILAIMIIMHEQVCKKTAAAH